MKNNLVLQFKNNTHQSINKNFIRQVLSKCLRKYKITRPTEISVVIVGKKTVRDLNKKYRGKDYVTDVLSFPQIQDKNLKNKYHLLGDIVICWPKLTSQAEKTGHENKDELQLLLEHSFKHLIGIHHK